MGKKKLAIVLPKGSRFCQNKPTALDICIKNLNIYTDFEIEVFCAEKAENPIDKFKVHYPDNKKDKLADLIKKIKEFNPDIIEVQQHLPSAGKIADSFKTTPIYLHKHFYIKKKKLNFISNYIISKNLKKLSGIIFVAEHLRTKFKKDFPKILKNRTFVLYNAIDFKHKVKLKHKKEQIIFAGRANNDKGALEFLQSLPLVLESSNYNVKFITAMYENNSNYIANLQKEYHEINATYPGRVEWIQDLFHEDVLKEFAESKIGVFPSKFPEGFALVAIEAQLAGLAVVSSKAPGLQEVNGDNAVYLNKVEPIEIAEKILDLVLSENKLEKLANNGENRVKDNFSIEKQNKILQSIRTYLINLED